MLDALKIVQLLDRKEALFKTYSLGMKQRLAIAAALLNDPDVLVLDEPTNGLDPQGIAEIRELIIRIAKKNKTILIASHQLDEIEKVCTDVVILKNGNLIKQNKIKDVLEESRTVEIGSTDMGKLRDILLVFKGVRICQELEELIKVELIGDTETIDLNRYCFENGVVLSRLAPSGERLEQKFLEITK